MNTKESHLIAFAFEAWSLAETSECRCDSHHSQIPTEQVCYRERLWRKYVELRDTPDATKKH